jgi:hypothetical protein
MKTIRFVTDDRGIGCLSLVVICLLYSRICSAQIISTFVPPDTSAGLSRDPTQAAPGSKRAAIHFMGGYTFWQFGLGPGKGEANANFSGLGTGGHAGVIGAVDVVGNLSSRVTVGGGGWFNRILDYNYVEQSPYDDGPDLNTTLSVYSFYGTVFYRFIGVQVGVVPSKGTLTITPDATIGGPSHSYSHNQTDANVFGTVRGASSRWAVVAGAGWHRYGPRVTDLHDGKSPSGNAFTAFATASYSVSRNASIDASFWYTGKDKNAILWTGNANQSRVTIGFGFRL